MPEPVADIPDRLRLKKQSRDRWLVGSSGLGIIRMTGSHGDTINPAQPWQIVAVASHDACEDPDRTTASLHDWLRRHALNGSYRTCRQAHHALVAHLLTVVDAPPIPEIPRLTRRASGRYAYSSDWEIQRLPVTGHWHLHHLPEDLWTLRYYLTLHEAASDARAHQAGKPIGGLVVRELLSRAARDRQLTPASTRRTI